ncbi:T9SS type A sorting domain-containing protein [Bacteroidota bacterium]
MNLIFGQNNFHIYGNNEDEFPTSIVNINPLGYFISIQRGNSQTYKYHSVILKLDDDLNYLNSLPYIDSNKIRIFKIFNYDGLPLVVGSSKNKFNGSLYIAKMTTNLAIIADTLLYIGDSIEVVDCMLNKDNNIVFVGKIIDDNDTNTCFFAEVDSNLNFVRIVKSNFSDFYWYGSIIQNPLEKYYLIDNMERIIKLDSNLYIQDTGYLNYPLPTKFISIPKLFALNDSIFLNLGRMSKFDPNNFIDYWIMAVIRSNFDKFMIDTITLEKLDTNILGNYQTIDIINDSCFVFGGTSNIDPIFPSTFEMRDHGIIIAKVNNNTGNIIWEKEFGGDAHYYLYQLSGISENECIALGTYWNWNINPINERDIFIFKFDSAGNLINNVKKINTRIENFISIYPNPARNVVNVSFKAASFEPRASSYELVDLVGKVLIRKSLDPIERDFSFNVSGLPEGIYILRIMVKDGMIRRKIMVVH